MGRTWALPLVLLLGAHNAKPETYHEASTKLTIDHVTVCGADLDAMQKAFAGIGLRTEYGGPHAGSPTHMAQLAFEDGSFVELIAPIEPQAPLPPQAPWPREMQGNAGPCGWTINVSQIEQQVARFRRRGIVASTPVSGGRMRLDHVELQWETAALASGQDPRLPFLIEDRTPHSLRAPTSPDAKRTGLTGVAVVVLGVRDLEASAALLQRAFGIPAPVIQQQTSLGARVAYFPGAPVALAAPLNDDSWLAERIRQFGERPTAVLLAARDFRATSRRFHVSFGEELAGRKVGWLNLAKTRDMRLGIIEP